MSDLRVPSPELAWEGTRRLGDRPGPGPTTLLCDWVCSTRFEDLPQAVRDETVTILYDQIGGMIACAGLPACQPVVDLVERVGGTGSSTIVGHASPTSVMAAALANGTIGHGDEVDATGRGGGHFAAVAVPTALTIGQHVRASGREFRRAIALGSEVAGRFVSVLGRHEGRPQFSASVGYTMGAAAAAGVLLGLDAATMQNALGLAAGGACGLYSHHIERFHQFKSLASGRAVEAGMLSAMLAGDGYHRPSEIMTVRHGFFDAFVGIRAVGWEVVEGLGYEYIVNNVAYKRYSVGGPDQAVLHSFLRLRDEHKISPDDIDQIEVSLSPGAFHTMTTDLHPSIHLATILCIAAIFGEPTFSHLHDDRYLSDARVLALRERAHIVIFPRATVPGQEADKRNFITVRTAGGAVVSRPLEFPIMLRDDLTRKFRALVGLRLDAARTADLEDAVWHVTNLDDVAPFVDKLAVS